MITLNPKRRYEMAAGHPIHPPIRNAVQLEVGWDAQPMAMHVEHADGSTSSWTLHRRRFYLLRSHAWRQS